MLLPIRGYFMRYLSMRLSMFAREELKPNVDVPEKRKQFFKDLREKGFRYSYKKNIS